MRPIHFCRWAILLFGIACVISPFGVIPLGAGEQDSGDGVASWQYGVSAFNGTGYDLPPASAIPTVAPPAPSTAAPYTMPTIPGATYTEALGFDAVEQVAGYSYSDLGTGDLAGNGPSLAAPVQTEPLPGPVSIALPAEESLAAPVGSGAVEPVSDQMEGQLHAAAMSEPLPLQQEVVRWYQYPTRWMKGWDSHAEFGLDGSNGNAETLAIQTGFEMKRQAKQYTFAIDIDYRQASSRGLTTEDNGRLNLDYDRLLGESAWSAFGKLGLEWDKFKVFDLRLNINSGLGYHWVRNKKASLVTRFGAGASKEFGAPDDGWTPEAVFGLEAERQLTSRQKIKGKIDYFPAWEDFADYRLVTDVSWEILLDGSENLSLKLAATDRYDSTPQGAEPNDLYYSLLLLYKF